METNLTENALHVLQQRYLIKDESGKVIETPERMFRRIADNIADSQELADKVYKLMCSTRFLPNSPSFNAGTAIKNYSACFAIPIHDSMDSIFETLKTSAKIFQSGGGCGYDFSEIRPKGAAVKSTQGIASGVVSFASVYNAAIETIKQGGCISANSYVRTARGLRQLNSFLNCRAFDDSHINEHVYAPDGFNTSWLSQDNGLAETIKIETEHGYSIEATYNEQIEIINKKGVFEWRQISSLKEGDWIKVVKGGHSGTGIQITKNTLGSHFNDSKDFKIPDCVDATVATILGMYMANGCLGHGYMTFSISNRYPDAYETLCNNMKGAFGLTAQKRKHREKDGDSKQADFKSTRLVELFDEMRWRKDGSRNAFIPESILKSPADVCYAFLRGMFECDGSVHKGGFPIYSSTSAVLIEETQQLLLSLGMVSHKSDSVCGKSGNPLYSISITQKDSLEKFIEKIGFLSAEKNSKLFVIDKNSDDIIPYQQYQITNSYNEFINKNNNGQHLRELYRKIQHYLEGHTGIREITRDNLTKLMLEYPQVLNGHFKEVSKPDFFYTRVTGISTAKTYTMDIEVNNTHSYIANGFHVKNKRRGAAIGLLSISHPEILDWIDAKDQGSTLSNFNLSVIITDKFMDAVKNNSDWNLEFKGKVYKTLPARELFEKICNHVHKTGDPGIVFIDNINKQNCHKHIGMIHNVNPCGEISIFTGVCPINYPELGIKTGDDIAESCNLGSFDISKYINIENKKMNWDVLAADIQVAVNFLDCIPDRNQYVTPGIEKGTKLLRKIGLGLMGFADALAMQGIPYNSQEALDFAEYLMEFMNYHSTKASVELAKIKGAFPAFKNSAWDTGEVWSFKNTTDQFVWTSLKNDIKKYGIRNCNVNALAPTGTLSILASCSSSIEPIFNVIYEKHISLGTLYETNQHFKRIMQERGLWTPDIEKMCSTQASIQNIPGIPDDIKKLFQTSHDIPYEQHVKMQAAFQKYCDLNLSKTINMPNSASVDDIKKAYILASNTCKGITVYRDGSKNEQVLYAKEIKATKPVEGSGLDIEFESPLPKQLPANRFKRVTGCSNMFITISVHDGAPVETFLNNSGAGGCTSLRDGLAIACSVSLRFVPPSKRKELALLLAEHLSRVQCRSSLAERTKRLQFTEMYNKGIINEENYGALMANVSDVDALSCPNALGQALNAVLNGEKAAITQAVLLAKKLSEQTQKPQEEGTTKKPECPQCHAALPSNVKCKTCAQCGWTNCGE